ncbi:MAG: hypothetical protein KAG14_04260 [Mycoplasmataceae bacterium]|nr:hypothetical protein [Mycoplasmataceae bacterium]
MEVIKLNIEGTIKEWSEGNLGYIDILALAEENTNDTTYVENISVYKEGKLEKTIQLRSGDNPIDVSIYLSEDSKYELKIKLSSDGSVS